MKSILVTGGSGFLGSALSKQLRLSKRFQVLTPSHSDLDCKDYEKVKQFCLDNEVVQVYHCAGRVSGIHGHNDQLEDLYETAMIGINTIKAARDADVPKLLYVGSTCAYPDLSTYLQPQDLFSASFEPTCFGTALGKALSVKLCSMIRSPLYISCMPSNIYGPGDCYDHHRSHFIAALIDRFESAKHSGSEVLLFGDGSPVRSVIYIDDCVNALIHCMNLQESAGKIINIGNSTGYTIREFAEMIRKLTGFEGPVRFSGCIDDNGHLRKVEDTTPLRRSGFSCEVELLDGLTRTIKAYKSR